MSAASVPMTWLLAKECVSPYESYCTIRISLTFVFNIYTYIYIRRDRGKPFSNAYTCTSRTDFINDIHDMFELSPFVARAGRCLAVMYFLFCTYLLSKLYLTSKAYKNGGDRRRRGGLCSYNTQHGR